MNALKSFARTQRVKMAFKIPAGGRIYNHAVEVLYIYSF